MAKKKGSRAPKPVAKLKHLFQHFMDLSLDIIQVSTIEGALKQHFKQDVICGMFKCTKCNVNVAATTQNWIELPPAVLCIQLNRFSAIGKKISKPVELKRTINMKHFVNTSGQGVEYKLVSMITHIGSSPNSGHYTAIDEAADGQYFSEMQALVCLVFGHIRLHFF